MWRQQWAADLRPMPLRYGWSAHAPQPTPTPSGPSIKEGDILAGFAMDTASSSHGYCLPGSSTPAPSPTPAIAVAKVEGRRRIRGIGWISVIGGINRLSGIDSSTIVWTDGHSHAAAQQQGGRQGGQQKTAIERYTDRGLHRHYSFGAVCQHRTIAQSLPSSHPPYLLLRASASIDSLRRKLQPRSFCHRCYCLYLQGHNQTGPSLYNHAKASSSNAACPLHKTSRDLSNTPDAAMRMA